MVMILSYHPFQETSFGVNDKSLNV